MSVKQWTRAEVAQRKSAAEVLFIIDNVVYDVTPFLDEHPGGHEVLLDEAGQDATERFDDVGHSPDAKEYMKKFVVGELVDSERVTVTRRPPTWQDQPTPPDQPSFLTSWKFPVLVGLALTLLYTYCFG